MNYKKFNRSLKNGFRMGFVLLVYAPALIVMFVLAKFYLND